MHSVRPARRRSSSAIRSSMRLVQPRESLAQSEPSGTGPSGNFASSTATSTSVIPSRWAKTMKAIRRNTALGKRRWPEPARSDLIRPFSSQKRRADAATPLRRETSLIVSSVGMAQKISQISLDFKFTLTCSLELTVGLTAAGADEESSYDHI